MQQPDLYKITAPGKLALNLNLADGSSFAGDEVVRVVPNKRLVCKGIWQKKAVYAKLFIADKARSYALRDEAGVRYLLAANIKTPTLMYSGEIAENKGYVLIFEAIERAQNAEENWKNLSSKARDELATRLVQEIAKHHNAGLLQTDLYLKNFLVDGNVIYTLDGDGIRKYKKLSQNQALENLSVLLSKFDVLELESWLQELLKTYTEARGWQALPDAEVIRKMTSAHRQKVASNYADKKVFRQCTDVNIHALEGLYIAVSSHALNLDLMQITEQMDTYFTKDNLLKSGRTCTVAVCEINGKQIVIKRYNIKNFWHGAGRALRQTRAAVSWANAHRLKLLDIATAKPVALIEERKFGLKGKAYFLCEYIDAPDAVQFFTACANKASRADAIKNIATLFYKLYLLRVSHGDTKATNIKIVNNQPVLIDLDSMAQHGFAFFALKAHARDLRRFMQNWKDDQALYNGFVKTFKAIYVDHTPLKMAGIL